ncbi:hypothetical protein Kpho01_39360 [Kitasatospora phosalacinea]|uniref:Uncharacterized protein n=1 Tax=Kitasatospora phosalacinea TaxID=2065 RepID=A0A9W6PGY5_9ACTN|nr:hypothetical protein Kpho01_39360 [Kitasatospora phosalacinea]
MASSAARPARPSAARLKRLACCLDGEPANSERMVICTSGSNTGATADPVVHATEQSTLREPPLPLCHPDHPNGRINRRARWEAGADAASR